MKIIRKKKKPLMPLLEKEDHIHTQCVSYYNSILKNKYGGVLFHVPNQGYRNRAYAVKLKAMGVLAGVSDLIYIYQGESFFIEVKTKNGKQTIHQSEFSKNIEKNGMAYCLIRSLNEFTELMDFIHNSVRLKGTVPEKFRR